MALIVNVNIINGIWGEEWGAGWRVDTGFWEQLDEGAFQVLCTCLIQVNKTRR